MRRTRKPRVVWLPPDPFNSLGHDGAITDITSSSIRHIEVHGLGPLATGDSIGTTFPLVGDGGNAENTIIGGPPTYGTTQTLSDMFNSGYRLRRVCGHIFCRLPGRPIGQGGFFGNVIVTAAMQVMRVDSSGLPVDTQAANPATYVNQDNPWIWRRSWMLTNFASNPIDAAGGQTNLGLSVREGTFVDQKTARIIGPDERLFMCLSCTMGFSQSEALDDFVVFDFDLRVLASLKSNLGNRRNASR